MSGARFVRFEGSEQFNKAALGTRTVRLACRAGSGATGAGGLSNKVPRSAGR